MAFEAVSTAHRDRVRSVNENEDRAPPRRGTLGPHAPAAPRPDRSMANVIDVIGTDGDLDILNISDHLD
jgi:hypothetical protein